MDKGVTLYPFSQGSVFLGYILGFSDISVSYNKICFWHTNCPICFCLGVIPWGAEAINYRCVTYKNENRKGLDPWAKVKLNYPRKKRQNFAN